MYISKRYRSVFREIIFVPDKKNICLCGHPETFNCNIFWNSLFRIFVGQFAQNFCVWNCVFYSEKKYWREWILFCTPFFSVLFRIDYWELHILQLWCNTNNRKAGCHCSPHCHIARDYWPQRSLRKDPYNRKQWATTQTIRGTIAHTVNWMMTFYDQFLPHVDEVESWIGRDLEVQASELVK